jgi:GMP synthase-like glutamine amidotransferase
VVRGHRLWVIDPSVNRPEDEGVAEILGNWDGVSRLFRPALEAGDVLNSHTGFDTDGVVLMGSASSVHDSPHWLRPLRAWLRPILDGSVRVPLLGICYGHQLIAHLAGGDVGWLQDDRARRHGVETSRLEGGRLLPGSHELRVMVSHREEVKRAPRRYRTCASRPGVAVDGLEHESLPIFSFQFHPEGREEFASHAEIPREEVDEVVLRDGRRLLGAFREYVKAG